jgi:hypothetical protein
LRIYHLTEAENVAKILAEGFVDGTNFEGQTGVWFSAPASFNLITPERAADTVVSLEVPDEVLEQYEREYYPPSLPKELADALIRAAGFREFCMPAAEANKYLGSVQQAPLGDQGSAR